IAPILPTCLSPPPAPAPLPPLSLHDALPICVQRVAGFPQQLGATARIPAEPGDERFRAVGPRHAQLVAQSLGLPPQPLPRALGRSEEHTSELQSRENLVCRLLREKNKRKADT